MLRSVAFIAVAAAGADAFMTAPLVSAHRVALRSTGACSSLRMVDWSEPKVDYSGAGADRGQMNKSDNVEEEYRLRTEEARKAAEKANVGWRSEYDPTGTLKEGDRDPHSGRLIIDPLKVPTSEQGAPASFAEYMERRAKKSGGKVVDIVGNDITDIRPTSAVHEGSWGAPAGKGKDSLDDFLGLGPKKDVGAPKLTAEQEEWNKKRKEEEAAREAEAEAKMQKWIADAAAKKAAGGQ